MRLEPDSAELRVEQGYQLLLAGSLARAQGAYQEAAERDQANMGAVYGQIRCQVLLGQLDDAAGQFDFLNEIHAGPDLAYIGALLAARKDGDSGLAARRLDEAPPPFPTVAPTRVPTVHSLPPSLLLPLPVSLLYTHSLPP